MVANINLGLIFSLTKTQSGSLDLMMSWYVRL